MGRARGEFDFPWPPEGPGGRSLLEALLRAMGSMGGNSGRNLPIIGGLGRGVIPVIALGVWLATGVYQVDTASQAVVRIFGLPQAPVVEGLHWRPPSPIGELDIHKVKEVREVQVGFRKTPPGQSVRIRSNPEEALMITGDENIVDVELIAQYSIKDITAFLFNISDPGDPERVPIIRDKPDGKTLRDVTEAALRQVVGSRNLDDILTLERAAVETETRELLQSLLDSYGAGIFIERVQLQTIKPPDPVQAAFLDVVSAKEEKEQLINQAKAYEADIVPRAQGEAEQMIRAAEAFKAARIAGSQGDSARFLSVLAEYKKSRDVTRRRLYLETMEQVLPSIKKFILAPDAGSGLLQLLPLQDAGPVPAPSTGR
ncbi:MAG: FtsH protease activity modulator HflK [Dehalococcoidia bacterium]|nr:FtsH protease activity modulator HflK [Dehalococcoidia bacterium]